MPKTKFPFFFQNNLQDFIVAYRTNLASTLLINESSKSLDKSRDIDEQAVLLRLQTLEENADSRVDYSIATLLEKHNKIKIIGNAGSGKTTLLRMIAVSACRGILNPTSNLPVILRVYDQDGYLGIEYEIKNQLEKISESQLSDEGLKTLLNQGRLLVLIDGIDEAESIVEYQFRIQEFINHYPKCSLVVTSRPITNTSILDFPAFQIAPLSSSEVRQLIDLWSKDNPIIADRFLAMLQSGLGLQSLATNPFLLRLMFDSYRKEGKIPSNKDRLQSSYIYFLLPFTSKLNSEQSENLAEKLALFLHRNKKTFITESELEANSDINLYSHYEATRNYLSKLVLSNILEKREEKYYFSHLLLQEYFCASSLKNLPNKKLVEFLIEYAGDPWWESVFSILAQEAPNTNEIASDLLEKNDPELSLIAAKFVFKNSFATENLRKKTAIILCKLLDKDDTDITLKASDLLIQINEPEIEDTCFNIIKTHSDKRTLAFTSATYILATKGKTSSDFYKLLATSLQDNNSTVRSQACKALGALNTKQSTEILIDVLKAETNQATLEQAISSLCRMNVSRKVNSAKLAELRVELNKLKQAGNDKEELHTWVEQLERELVFQKLSLEESK